VTVRNRTEGHGETTVISGGITGGKNHGHTKKKKKKRRLEYETGLMWGKNIKRDSQRGYKEHGSGASPERGKFGKLSLGFDRKMRDRQGKKETAPEKKWGSQA